MRYWKLDCSLIFLISLTLFLLRFAPNHFIGFETRFVCFAKEMLHSGLHFFPYNNGQPYPDYTAFSTWLIVLASSLKGQITSLSVMLPTAIISSATVMGCYLIGALQQRRWGLLACVWLFLCYTFVAHARTLSQDQGVAAVSCFCFYIAFSQTNAHRRWRLLWLPLLLFLGFLMRGPIGFVIPAGIIFGVVALNHSVKKLALYCLFAGVLLALAITVLLLAAYSTGGEPFMQDVLQMQFLGRLADRLVPWYFYPSRLISQFALAGPVAIGYLLLRGKVLFSQANTNPDDRLLKNLVIWVVIVLVGMSIPSDKKVRYLLAIAPACALIASHLFVITQENRTLMLFRRLVVCFCQFLPFIAYGTTAIGLMLKEKYPLLQGLPLIPSFWGLMILSIATVCARYLSLSRQNKQSISLVIAAVTVWLCQVNFVEPIQQHSASSQGFINAFSLVWKANEPVIFFKIPHNDIDNALVANFSRPLRLMFLSQREQLQEQLAGQLLITHPTTYQTLPPLIKRRWTVVYQGQLNHEQCALLRKKTS